MWSALDVASIALSNRAHSTLVIGPRWNEKFATYVSRASRPEPALLWKFLRSHIRSAPSSAPVASM